MSDRRQCEITVRSASESDILEIVALLKASPTAAQWPAEAFLSYCSSDRQSEPVPTRRMRAIFIASPLNHSPSDSENIVGFAAFSALADGNAVECELDNMAVDAAWRRRGIGHQLLASGFAWMSTPVGFSTSATPAVGHFSRAGVIWLEVRASNTDAIVFYQHAGFAIAGRRTSYYSRPTEDAIVMRKSL